MYGGGEERNRRWLISFLTSKARVVESVQGLLRSIQRLISSEVRVVALGRLAQTSVQGLSMSIQGPLRLIQRLTSFLNDVNFDSGADFQSSASSGLFSLSARQPPQFISSLSDCG